MQNSISLKRKDTEKTLESSKEIAKELIIKIPKTIHHFFPQFNHNLNLLKEKRNRTKYKLSEIAMGAISMFIFKEGSRNSFNSDRQDKTFRSNYEKLLGKKLPHMDTVDDVFRKMSPKEIEKIKVKMIRELIEKKVLEKHKLLGKYYLVAIDGTGVTSYHKKHCEKCLTRESKTGKKIWFHNVLEAKLVTPNGLSLSLATEWIDNNGEEYDKQDCERKAFNRLAEKLKHNFPRLPICIVGDGLYPTQTVFKTCKENNWEYIIILKDGNLPTVWEEVRSLLPLQKENRLKVTQLTKQEKQDSRYRWVTDINYKGHNLNWFEMRKEESKHVFVTSIRLEKKRVPVMVFFGRLRWKIENEGFNTQKNGGYNLEHKYSEVSLRASKNYYQSLQIASIINQLLVIGQKLKRYRVTVKHIWKNLLAFMLYGKIEEEKIKSLLERRIQIRLE